MWLLNLNYRRRFKLALIYAIAFHAIVMAVFLRPFEKSPKANLPLSQKKTMKIGYQILEKTEVTKVSSVTNKPRAKTLKKTETPVKNIAKTPQKILPLEKKKPSFEKSNAKNATPKENKKMADALSVLKESQARLSLEAQKPTKPLPKQEIVPIQLQSSSVNFDTGISSSLSNKELNYQSRIRETLHSQLKIPKGKVAKCRLKIGKEGKLILAEILESPTHLYKEFLMKELSKISFPPFDKTLTQQDHYTVVVTLFA